MFDPANHTLTQKTQELVWLTETSCFFLYEIQQRCKLCICTTVKEWNSRGSSVLACGMDHGALLGVPKSMQHAANAEEHTHLQRTHEGGSHGEVTQQSFFFDYCHVFLHFLHFYYSFIIELNTKYIKQLI